MIGLIGMLALFVSAAALADPPTRVARLSHMDGTVTFSPAGEEDWAAAQANRPVVTGDRLWADANSRFELQVGAAAVRVGSETSINVLNLDDQVGQFQLAQGTIDLRVRRIEGGQFYEIDTPNLAFSVRKPGEYRIDVDPQGNTTTLRVFNGEGEAYGEGAAYVIGQGQLYTFTGQGLSDYQTAALPQPDAFDQWAFDRDRREDRAVTARYVSPDLIGYSDLDEYGTWRDVQGYGNVWVPTQVASGWAPYRDGHWAWVEPYGWTWIDDAPWGFAPFHYGRWAYIDTRWCWVPGPIAVRPVYAPALVAFVGGGGFSIAVGGGPVAGIAWFPLGVGEVYRPSYVVSRSYFTNINVSNTVVNTTVINNYYNNQNVNVVYRNREVPNAVVAVSATSFASGHDVRREAVQVSRQDIDRHQPSAVAAVAPTHASVIAAVAAGATAAAVAKPAARILDRRVVAKATPPQQAASFAAKQQALAAQPGKPLEQEKLQAMSRERPAAQRNVQVVAPSGKAAAAPMPLPPSKGGGVAQERRGQAPSAAAPQPPQQGGVTKEERRSQPPTAAVPQPPQQGGATKEERRGQPPTAAAPQPPQDRGATKEERRGQPPTAEVPRPPQERGMAKGAQPPTAAAPQPPQQGGATKEERRGQPPTAAAPQSPQERGAAKEERRGPPPTANAPQPPQERRGQPPTAAAPQPPQERAAQERRAPPPGAQPQQPPREQPQARQAPPREQPQARQAPPREQPQARQAPPQPPQAAREERRGPPPAQQQQPPREQPQARQAPAQAQAQQQAQARQAPPPQQTARGEPPREERGKEKEKEKKEGQPQ
jgi:hypothetical protein